MDFCQVQQVLFYSYFAAEFLSWMGVEFCQKLSVSLGIIIDSLSLDMVNYIFFDYWTNFTFLGSTLLVHVFSFLHIVEFDSQYFFLCMLNKDFCVLWGILVYSTWYQVNAALINWFE